jgi:hypothetical protein
MGKLFFADPRDAALYAELERFCGGKGSRRPGPCPKGRQEVHNTMRAHANAAQHQADKTKKALDAAAAAHDKAPFGSREKAQAPKKLEAAKAEHAAKAAKAQRLHGKANELERQAAVAERAKKIDKDKRAAARAGKSLRPAGAGKAPWKGGTPDPGKVYNVPTAELHVDPARFQYKLNVDRSGVTDELKGVRTFNPDFAGVISVWKDPANGKTYVVNGHHRHELASRLGARNLAVRYVKAGSAKEARAVGALINIAEGRGTPIDAAKFMRDTGVGLEDLGRHGVSLKGKVAADAATLTKLNDRAFDRVARGTLDPAKALAVAKHLPDHDKQEELFRLLDKREEAGKDLSPKVIEEMAREMAATPKHTKTENTLFGPIENEESLFVPRNELKAHIRSELTKEVNDFMAVASKRRAEKVGKAAGNVLDTEANRKIAEEADRVRNVFDTLVNRKGEISDALNKAAAEYAAATTKKGRDDAREKAFQSVRGAVLREAGLDREGTSSAGSRAASAPQPPAAAPAAAADGGRAAAGAGGLTPHPAKVEAALDRYANRGTTARGGGLFGGEDLQGRRGFAKLPDGAPVVFTTGEFQGRTGKIVHDKENNRVVAEVDGRPGLVPVDHTSIEPLNAAQSWRTEASAAPLEQKSLLSADAFLPQRHDDAVLYTELTRFARGLPAVRFADPRDRRLYAELTRFARECGRLARGR